MRLVPGVQRYCCGGSREYATITYRCPIEVLGPYMAPLYYLLDFPADERNTQRLGGWYQREKGRGKYEVWEIILSAGLCDLGI
jgi:hypothetical protein